MLGFGVAFILVVCGLSLFLKNPPRGYVPAAAAPRRADLPAPAAAENNSTPREMLRSAMFWKLWFTYFIGAGAGLMVIGSVRLIASRGMSTSSCRAGSADMEKPWLRATSM